MIDGHGERTYRMDSQTRYGRFSIVMILTNSIHFHSPYVDPGGIVDYLGTV